MSWSGVPERLAREWAMTDQERALDLADRRWCAFARQSGHDLSDVVEQLVDGVDERQMVLFALERDCLLPEFTD